MGSATVSESRLPPVDESPALVLHPDPSAVAPALPPAPTELYVEATVHLPGLGLGERGWVNPNDPYMAELIAGHLIVPVDE